MTQQVLKFSLGVNASVDVTAAADSTELGAGEAAWLIIADNAVLDAEDVAALIEGIIHHIKDGQVVREIVQTPDA